MSGYEYEDETEKVTWSIVNDIKQVTEDIISTIIDSIKEVSSDWIDFYEDDTKVSTLKHVNMFLNRNAIEEIILFRTSLQPSH